MSASIVQATLRISVVGDAGRADLVVPIWADVASLAESYAETVGITDPPGLTTRTSRVLTPASTVAEAGLRHGDVVVAVTPDSLASDRDPATEHPTGRVLVAESVQALLLVLAAVLAAGGAAVLAASGGSGPIRATCLVLLIACALVTAAPVGPASGPRVRARTAASPAFAAGAGFAATYSEGPGGLLLGVAVAALAATVFAAVARAFLDDEHDELVEVWLVVAGALAVLSTAMLLVGASGDALLAVLFAVAVVAARLLPFTVVDVPDQALLDLDRLAVTAWSAREQPRGSRRRRTVVRLEGVAKIVHRGLRLVSAGTVVVAATAAAAGPLLVRGTGSDLQEISALVMTGLGGVALALVARAFRSALPRRALRLASLVVLAFLGVSVLRSYGATLHWWAFAATAVLSLLTVVAAVSLGRGWRSVWWARAADIVEGLAIVLVVAMVPLASGFYQVARGFTV